MPVKERKWNHIQCQLKPETHENMGSKNRNVEQIENSNNVVYINPNIFIIALNVNGLMHQLKEIVRVDQKHDLTMFVCKKLILSVKKRTD